MKRSRIVMLGAVAAVVGIGVLLIPAGGGANTAGKTKFTAEILQSGSVVSSIAVKGCTGRSTTGTLKSALSARAKTDAAGAGNTGNGEIIKVTKSTTTLATLTALDTAVVMSDPGSLPCTGSVTFVFTPFKATGAASNGTATSKTVTITGSAS